jgi:hypothetical protein
MGQSRSETRRAGGERRVGLESSVNSMAATLQRVESRGRSTGLADQAARSKASASMRRWNRNYNPPAFRMRCRALYRVSSVTGFLFVPRLVHSRGIAHPVLPKLPTTPILCYKLVNSLRPLLKSLRVEAVRGALSPRPDTDDSEPPFC